MNDSNLQQIFAHYIEKFEMINNKEHREYYKWQITKRFHEEMDSALNAPEEEFADKLKELKKLTENLIDSRTQPFGGIVKLAQKDPETVREMFRELYSDDGGDIGQRQKKVQSFLLKSNELLESHSLGGFMYKNDMHSVTGYLFFYDPDHNYLYKASHAQIFADCIGFYDDWGSGDTVDLSCYYRMCDQLAKAIKDSKELMATDASRFENGWGVDPSGLYADPEKHILAFDLIYCCSTYGLFDGISFERPKTKERQLRQERREKALQLYKELEEAEAQEKQLEEAKEYIDSIYSVGAAVRYKTFLDSNSRNGIIKSNTGKIITVEFPDDGEKKLKLPDVLTKGFITVDVEGYSDKIKNYTELLEKEESIKRTVINLKKEFGSYADYLE